MYKYPNLEALLGSAAAVQSLLSLENGKVTPLFLLSCSAGKMFHLGKQQQQDNNKNDDGNTTNTDTGSTPNSWIFHQPQITSISNPRLRVKAANALAEAIKKCAAADHGHSSTDGAVGRDNKEKFEKKVELLIPKVDFVDEEEKQLAVPVDIHDPNAQNKNAKHRSGNRLKKQKRADEIERILGGILARCGSDEEKERKMKTREFLALQREQQDILRTINENAGIVSSSSDQNKNNNVQQQDQLAAGTRRDRDGNTAATNNNDDDEYDDL